MEPMKSSGEGLPKIVLPGKPTYKKIAEDYDFFQLFRQIERKYKNCFLLESLGEESYVSRHHVIGFDPTTIIAAEGKKAISILNTRTNSKQIYDVDNPYYALREIFPDNVISRRYAGGLVGYLGYDCVNYFERTLDVKSSSSFEPFKFGVYRDGLIYDQMSGEIFYFHYDLNRFEEIEALLREPDLEYGAIDCEFLGDSMSQDQHRQAVLKTKADIAAGLIFQCEVGFKSRFRVTGDKTQIYAKLRDLNPSPHMYYVRFEDQVIIGASPELLFRLRNGEMESFPLAGTAKRGADKSQDLKLARALLNDPKEIAEHNMLVDLHRNDVGKVAKFGTVKVRQLMDIKRYSHVQHISSEICGIIRDDVDMFDALAANFPAGTLTGAPKVEAIKIIDGLEPEGRGPYGGGLGQFSFNRDCTFAIPIRSVFISGEQAYAQTSGGNVYDSEPDAEYREIERKLSAMKNVLNSFEKSA